MCTVGYGDVTPVSTCGRFAIMAIVFFAVVYVPMQTNKLIEMMNRQSVYARAKYKPRGIAKHVIVCGDLTSTSLQEFFRELFHEDHENVNLNAVVLQPGMDYEIYALIALCLTAFVLCVTRRAALSRYDGDSSGPGILVVCALH